VRESRLITDRINRFLLSETLKVSITGESEFTAEAEARANAVAVAVFLPIVLYSSPGIPKLWTLLFPDA
jgi:hypothetical protein